MGLVFDGDLPTLDDEGPEQAGFSYGETIYAPEDAQEPHSKVLRDSFFLQSWVTLQKLYRDSGNLHPFPGMSSFSDSFEHLSGTPGFCTERLELLKHIWLFCSTQPNGSQLRFQDVLFASFCNKFGSPCLCTLEAWSQFPSDSFQELCNLSIFDLRDTEHGLCHAHKYLALAEHSRVGAFLSRQTGLLAFYKYLRQVSKNAEASPLVVATSVASEVQQSVEKFERDFNSGVVLTKRQRGSDAILDKLIKMAVSAKYEALSLTGFSSTRMIEEIAQGYLQNPDGLEAESKLIIGADKSLGFKLKPSVLDGVTHLTRENFKEILGVFAYAVAISGLATLAEVLTYINLIEEFFDTYPEDFDLLVAAELLARRQMLRGLAAGGGWGPRFKEFGSSIHPFWELNFLSKSRIASTRRTEMRVQSALANRTAAPPGNPSAGTKPLQDSTVPSLVNKAHCPHKGNGCVNFHVLNTCSLGKSCPFSHICPLLSCGGKAHSFSGTHRDPDKTPYLSWSGQVCKPVPPKGSKGSGKDLKTPLPDSKGRGKKRPGTLTR